MTASIIIPAHNESRQIGSCLEALIGHATSNEMEIIVVANGCNDDTVNQARKWLPDSHVIDINTASKVAALNAGDAIAKYANRIYLDADAILDNASAHELIKQFKQPAAMLVYPSVKMNMDNTSWSVRAYYRIWLSLPYNQIGVGCGVYALTAKARARFSEFPKLISDDGYVRSQFSPTERIRLDSAKIIIAAPRTLPSLIKVKIRSRIGQYQLQDQFPALKATDRKQPQDQTPGQTYSIVSLPALVVYIAINLLTRALAKWKYSKGDYLHWQRDDTTR